MNEKKEKDTKICNSLPKGWYIKGCYDLVQYLKQVEVISNRKCNYTGSDKNWKYYNNDENLLISAWKRDKLNCRKTEISFEEFNNYLKNKNMNDKSFSDKNIISDKKLGSQ